MTEKDEILKEKTQGEGESVTLDEHDSDMHNTDVHFESEDESESLGLQIKKLREKNRVCEKDKKEYLDGWQRMRADFANARKEEEARRGELIKFASEGLIEDLLPVLDSFSSAFANKEAWEKVDPTWRKGVEYIYAQFYSVLESRGLASLGVVDEKFDPRIHTALEEIASSSDSQVGTVAEVVHKGYRFHSKVVRPASVKVFGHPKD